jgi:hypothetical protein
MAVARLPELSTMREERLRARLPLSVLSARARIPIGPLSEAERGIRKLSERQEARRRRVIESVVEKGSPR